MNEPEPPVPDGPAAGVPSLAAPAAVTLETISVVMGLFGLVFILIVAVLASLNERHMLYREAGDHAENAAFFLADHAQRLFEVSDVALRSTTLAIGSQSWDEIEHSRHDWDALKATDNLLPYVEDLWLNDETGRLRLSSFSFPSPASTIADRPILPRIEAAGDALVIGEPIVGKLTHRPSFLVARRLANPDGSFRGVVSVTLDLAYFTDYWKRLALPNEERIAIVRARDGDVLASFRSGSIEALDAASTEALKAAIAVNPESGTFQPTRRTYGFYHRVGDLPLYTTVEYARARVQASWYEWLLRLAPLVAAAMLGLASIMMLGRRQGQREARAAREIAAAQAALAGANQDLERRVAIRTADLEETGKEIQRFAYIVSHDLRAPLVNVMGFTAELQTLRPALFQPGAQPDPDVQRDFDEAIGFITASIDKMDRLIKTILALSREGRRSFFPETIDLTALLRSIVGGLAHQIQSAGASVRLGALPPLVGDRIAVEHIVSNLIDNAVKYLSADRPGQIDIRGYREGDRVILTISDNGRGIADDDRERVFELFRRAGPQDRPGEGIGLAHVRALVRRLGGTISLESQLGQGSVFTVKLPDMALPADAEHEP